MVAKISPSHQQGLLATGDRRNHESTLERNMAGCRSRDVKGGGGGGGGGGGSATTRDM